MRRGQSSLSSGPTGKEVKEGVISISMLRKRKGGVLLADALRRGIALDRSHCGGESLPRQKRNKKSWGKKTTLLISTCCPRGKRGEKGKRDVVRPSSVIKKRTSLHGKRVAGEKGRVRGHVAVVREKLSITLTLAEKGGRVGDAKTGNVSVGKGCLLSKMGGG